MRITDEEKRTMLEEVLNKHRSSKKVAEEFHTDYVYFKRLLARAREHGIESVLHSSCRQTYSNEFKLEVVNFIWDGGTYGQAAAKYGMQCSVVRDWYLKYTEGGTESLFSDDRGRKKMSGNTSKTTDDAASSDELEELRRQNKELQKRLRHAEMENEFLKKLDALVRERIERENKR